MTSDPLTETLQNFGMTGVFYCSSELRAPWGIALPALPGTVMFHVLTDGEAWVDVEGEPCRMAAGDLVLVPHGTGHTIAGSPEDVAVPLFDLPRVELTDRYERLAIDGGGAPASLLCGAVSFTDQAVGRLMRSLPPLLVVDRPDERERLRALVEVMTDEAHAPGPGTEVVTARLADVLVVRSVRGWLDSATPEKGWLAALRDPGIGRALAAFHAEPGRPWTLATLAEAAGMSRSSFAARFTRLLGEAPMAHVTSWRMDLAARLILEGDLGLGRIAARVGYTSEPAFNRAFRRAHGVTPGAWRRAQVKERRAPVSSAPPAS